MTKATPAGGEAPALETSAGDVGGSSGAGTPANNSALFGRGMLYVVVSASQLLIGALVSPILAHVIGDPAEFGRLASAIALHQLLLVVALVGLDQAIVLKRAEDGHDLNAKALVSAAVLIACAVTGLLWVTARWWAVLFGFDPASPLMTATVLWTVPSAAVLVLMGVLMASDRLRSFSLVSLLGAVGGPVLGIFGVVLLAGSVETYAWGLLAADAIAAITAVCFIRPHLRGAFSWPLVRPALVFGLPLMLGSLSSFVLNAGDRIILLGIAGPAEVGRYQVAYTVGFIAAQLVSLAGMAWTPRFAAVSDRLLRWRIIGQSRDAIYGLLSPVVLGIILGAPVLLRIVAPPSFRPETLLPVVFLILLSAYPLAASRATGAMLITTRRTRPLAFWAAVCAAVNVVLNLIFVPIAGIAGAAAATLIAFALQAIGQRISVGDRDSWPRTPTRMLVQASIVIMVATIFVLLPHGVAWDAARFCLGLACLPWAWRELQRARRG